MRLGLRFNGIEVRATGVTLWMDSKRKRWELEAEVPNGALPKLRRYLGARGQPVVILMGRHSLRGRGRVVRCGVALELAGPFPLIG